MPALMIEKNSYIYYVNALFMVLQTKSIKIQEENIVYLHELMLIKMSCD